MVCFQQYLLSDPLIQPRCWSAVQSRGERWRHVFFDVWEESRAPGRNPHGLEHTNATQEGPSAALARNWSQTTERKSSQWEGFEVHQAVPFRESFRQQHWTEDTFLQPLKVWWRNRNKMYWTLDKTNRRYADQALAFRWIPNYSRHEDLDPWGFVSCTVWWFSR